MSDERTPTASRSGQADPDNPAAEGTAPAASEQAPAPPVAAAESAADLDSDLVATLPRPEPLRHGLGLASPGAGPPTPASEGSEPVFVAGSAVLAEGAASSALPLSDPLPTLPSNPPDPFRTTHGRPLFGATLWTFGALLWAYVVLGEWVLNLDLPEGLAFVLMLASYAGAWFLSVRDLAEKSPTWQRVVPGVAGLVLFLLTLLFVSMLFGSTRRTSIAMVSIGLWFISALVYWAGRRLSAPRRVELRGMRLMASICLWIASGLGTLVSLLSTLA